MMKMRHNQICKTWVKSLLHIIIYYKFIMLKFLFIHLCECMPYVRGASYQVSDCLELALQVVTSEWWNLSSSLTILESRLFGHLEFQFRSVQMSVTTEFALWLLSTGSVVRHSITHYLRFSLLAFVPTISTCPSPPIPVYIFIKTR